MYVPPGIVRNEMLSRIMDTSEEWVVPRTGIRERRYVERRRRLGASWGEGRPGGARRRRARSRDIDLVIFATMTPDHYFRERGLLANGWG